MIINFYVPIIYIILACICVRYRFKFLTNELVYKFLADYTPILAQRLLTCINSKVVEMFLYSITRNALSYL
uniref:CPXV160 protein n=1 Tax=Strongyloides papillosus TaxID=174720 RepID=A0A0N5BTP3_STREA